MQCAPRTELLPLKHSSLWQHGPSRLALGGRRAWRVSHKGRPCRSACMHVTTGASFCTTHAPHPAPSAPLPPGHSPAAVLPDDGQEVWGEALVGCGCDSSSSRACTCSHVARPPAIRAHACVPCIPSCMHGRTSLLPKVPRGIYRQPKRRSPRAARTRTKRCKSQNTCIPGASTPPVVTHAADFCPPAPVPRAPPASDERPRRGAADSVRHL